MVVCYWEITEPQWMSWNRDFFTYSALLSCISGDELKFCQLSLWNMAKERVAVKCIFFFMLPLCPTFVLFLVWLICFWKFPMAAQFPFHSSTAPLSCDLGLWFYMHILVINKLVIRGYIWPAKAKSDHVTILSKFGADKRIWNYFPRWWLKVISDTNHFIFSSLWIRFFAWSILRISGRQVDS